MPLDISSWMAENLQQYVAKPLRRMLMEVSTDTIGGYTVNTVDVSPRVMRWPRVRSEWQRLAPNNIVIDLTNADGALNTLFSDPLALTRKCWLQLGVTGRQICNDPGLDDESIWTNLTSYWVFTGSYAYIDQVVSDTSERVLRDENIGVDSPVLAPTPYIVRALVNSWQGGTFAIRVRDYNGGTNYFLETYSYIGESSYWISETFTVEATSAEVGRVIIAAKPGDLCKFAFERLEVIRLDENEYVSVFEGNIRRTEAQDGKVALSVTDKWDQFTRRHVGNRDEPISFADTTYLISEFAWTLITSFGGLDSTQDSSNPDIAYDYFTSWKNYVDEDFFYVQGVYEGDHVNEIVSAIAKYTDSAIFVDTNNKLTFKRFTASPPQVESLTCDHVVSCKASTDEDLMANRIVVPAAYDQTSDYYRIRITYEDTPSVNSFGIYDYEEDEDAIWLVNSLNANNYAGRIGLKQTTPFHTVQIYSSLHASLITIGDTVYFANPQLGIANSFRVYQKELDLDRGQTVLVTDEALLYNPFILDVSTLDGDDRLL